MKRCPSCQKTYTDDAPDFCPNDGMRLVKEEAAAFDPEKTVMRSDVLENAPAQSSDLASTLEQQPQHPPAPAPNAQPTTQPPQGQPQYEQPPPPQQQWRPQEGNQFQQQAGWSPAPAQQQPAASPAWGSPYPQQQPMGAPYQAPFVPPASGRSRAIAIAALVFGVDAATVMALAVIRDRDFLRILFYALPSLAIALGLTSLLLALKKPSRFGGVELAIAGLALGAAGLVFILMRRF